MIILVISGLNCSSQFFHASDSLNKKRLTGVVITESLGYAGSMVMLNELWYKYYDRTPFHTFNDNPEWLQMDKGGHAMVSSYLGLVGYKTLRWSGVKKSKALWYGGLLGSGYLLSMEVLDGFAEEWGFSFGDILANSFGSASFMLQEHFWDDQRIVLKFSAHLTDFAAIRPSLLGYNNAERIFKDYNGQTYWISVNPASFMKENTWMPAWLNVAAGYGATNMISGRESDNPLPEQYQRYRQYYLSLDVDFRKIPTNKAWMKPILGLLNIIKVPAPALELSKHGMRWRGLYF